MLTFFKPSFKKITIADLLGKPLQFHRLAFDENHLEIDLSQFISGSYTISVVYDDVEKENKILTVVH